MKRFLIILFITILHISALSAQKRWTLAQCIEHGLQHNLSIRQMQGENEQLHIREQALRNNRFLPNVEFGTSQRFNLGRSLNRENVYEDVSSHITNASLQAEMLLFDGFHTRHALRENHATIRASEESMQARKDDLKLNIANLFYRAAIHKEIHQIAIEQRQLTKEQILRVEARIEAGTAPESLLLEMHAQLAEDELNVIETRGNVNMALIELARWINLTEGVEYFDIIVESENELLPLLRNGQEVQTNLFPQIRMEQHRLESLEWAYQRTRSNRLPTLVLGGSIGSTYFNHSRMTDSPFGEQFRNNAQTLFYATLRVPIFDRFSTRNNLRTVRIDIQNQQIALQESKNILQIETLQIRTNLQNAIQRLQASNESVAAHEEVFRFATEMFNAGRMSAYEHLLARQRLANSQSQAAQARFNLAYQSFVYKHYHRQY